MYKDLTAEASEAMVLGTFLVDILPFRGFDRLIMAYTRALTVDDLPQSSIYLRGALVSGSTHAQTKLEGNSVGL